MARKEKLGLRFYSVDTDLFFNRKIKRLVKTFSGNGYLVYSYILTEIYRDKGCFIAWDSDTAFDVSDTLNIKESKVNEIVNYCCKLGLFNKELLASKNVLSTKNIQEFWVKVSKGANRKVHAVPEEITLLIEESTPKHESITLKPEESKQSKVNYTKVKESKVNNLKKVPKNVFDFKKSLLDFGFKKNLVDEWMLVRKTKRATNTETTFKKFVSEIKKSTRAKNEILQICIEKDWKTFDSNWIETEKTIPENGNYNPNDTDMPVDKNF